MHEVPAPAERTTADRIHAAVAGLAAADALTWSAWYHRMSQLPPRRGVRLGEAWQHARDGLTTSLPMPYLHASSPRLVDPAGPTDDTEWFVVAARNLLDQRLDGTAADRPGEIWRELAGRRAADEDTVRGRIGTVIALANLHGGMEPPATGNDNPHYFDDLALVRAVAAGLLAPGSPRVAADLAEQDAAVTHALDGVWGARATAALVSCLVGGADGATAEEAALAELPADSWCAHVVAECLAVADSGATTLDLAARLERRAVDHVYAYANQAPESLGLLLAHLRAATGGESLLLGAVAHPRHADGLVPLAGAVAGAAFGDLTGGGDLPVLGGVCVRDLAGVPLDAVVISLVQAVEQEVAR